MNKITLRGIPSDIQFSHEVYGEKFYKMFITSERKSGEVDTLPCIVPELFLKKIEVGTPVTVIGTIRTRNENVGERKALNVFVFVEGLSDKDSKEDINLVEFDGYICKEPVHRVTPLGREITDITLACNRKTGISDYIPTICWGRLSRTMEMVNIRTHIVGTGRLQSRTYIKRINGSEIEKVAYELSVISAGLCDDGRGVENDLSKFWENRNYRSETYSKSRNNRTSRRS